jgi:hypothetical protein
VRSWDASLRALGPKRKDAAIDENIDKNLKISYIAMLFAFKNLQRPSLL